MLVFADLETGGLPENNAADMPPVLEAAVIVTDNDLNEIDSTTIIIHHDETTLGGMNEWCIEQHGKTGLTQASRNSEVSLSDAENTLIEWLTPHLEAAGSMDPETGELKICRPPLCGSSVSFDRKFLSVFMPKFIRLFHYRNIDVSSFKEFFKVRDLPAFDTGDREPLHRALDDIRHSIRELRHYMQTIEGPLNYRGEELHAHEVAE